VSSIERRARELRQRERVLLDAAIALLDRDDWQAVTVEAIAARAEYAKGTIYRHFASKDDLYVRLAADWTAGTHAELEALDAERPFEPVLRDVVAVCWRRMTGDRAHARLLQHVQRADFLEAVSPASRAALDAAEARILGLVAGLIDWGIAEGAIPRAPLEPRLFAVTALLMGALRLHALWGGHGVADPERLVAEAALAILRT
jgi:AcrR family transcriptional regulator